MGGLVTKMPVGRWFISSALVTAVGIGVWVFYDWMSWGIKPWWWYCVAGAGSIIFMLLLDVFRKSDWMSSTDDWFEPW